MYQDPSRTRVRADRLKLMIAKLAMFFILRANTTLIGILQMTADPYALRVIIPMTATNCPTLGGVKTMLLTN